LPPFFIPIVAYLLWLAALVAYFPVLRLGLYLSDQFIAGHFFISHLILVFAWALSGPVVAAVLSVLSAIVSIYLGLGVKEPAFFLQAPLYSALFFSTALYLQAVQQTAKDKQIDRDRALEDLTLTQKESQRQERLGLALRAKIERFLDLQHFAEELKSCEDLPAAGDLIAREASKLLARADECLLYLVDEEHQELSLLFASPQGPALAARQRRGDVLDQWVMKRAQAVMIEDTRNDFRFAVGAPSGAPAWRSACSSPLVIENKVLGVIRANALEPGRFTADDLRLLDIFASFGAVTLRNILLFRTAEELATRDSLTGLFVKRFFRERLEAELERAANERGRFSVILLDIDHFKRYNDEYGHSAGDLVLRNVAAAVQKNLEPGDVAARYGGEEFVLLLPSRPKAEAVAFAERLRGEIESSAFVLRRVEKRVTASFGVAGFPTDGRTADGVLRAADKNLYEAKSAGRNRVCASA